MKWWSGPLGLVAVVVFGVIIIGAAEAFVHVASYGWH